MSEQEANILYSDNIGDTLFSKKWVLKVLFNATQQIKSDNEDSIVKDSLDSELCQLWDMSMSKDVALFLQEVNGVDIFLEIILGSTTSRLTEISIGIMANMACQEDICKDITNREKLIEVMLIIMDHRDAPILVEVTRLVHVAISKNETREKWMSAIQHSTFLENLIFILENSMHDELLLNCSLLLSSLLTYNKTLLEIIDKEKLAKAVVEAIQQTKVYIYSFGKQGRLQENS
ncbi:protein saal1-like isoform X2 [Dendronephthya gigantea]|uniref:protein saal1-like isoform X2 n=1 Tax=Dendronephthya gigantea TaxID=151771 RepID=UPI00106A25CC|nr:protein saal1-like isoform X2 [Dendronephthya gigantea]